MLLTVEFEWPVVFNLTHLRSQDTSTIVGSIPSLKFRRMNRSNSQMCADYVIGLDCRMRWVVFLVNDFGI